MSPQIILCPGIDPSPSERGPEAFKSAVKTHLEFVTAVKPKWIKPNLGFFLRYGSAGVAQLEEFVTSAKPHTQILLDGKFGELSNTLEAYLDFAFQTLGVHAVTLNPFLGEKTISDALERALSVAGANARVFVLAATSQFSSGPLAYIQKDFASLLSTCEKIRKDVTGDDVSLRRTLGVVVGAGRHEVMFSDALRATSLSVLAPGLGAQGADWNVVSKVRESGLGNEIQFPLSRGIFEAGNVPASEAIARYQDIKRKYFKETE